VVCLLSILARCSGLLKHHRIQGQNINRQRLLKETSKKETKTEEKEPMERTV
jgi:hypothetical protein